MRLRPEEPAAGPWRAVPLVTLLERCRSKRDGPTVLAIDGRSSSGKTTLARKLAAVAGKDAAVVHSDDIAWWHSRFGWTDLLTSGVIEPYRRGQGVEYTPPAWKERGRVGAIVVSAETSLLVVEGVGSSRRELVPWIDASIWVRSDEVTTTERNAERVAGGETTSDALAAWMSEEIPFLAEDRPWERASFIVAGTPTIPHDQAFEAVVAGLRDGR